MSRVDELFRRAMRLSDEEVVRLLAAEEAETRRQVEELIAADRAIRESSRTFLPPIGGPQKLARQLEKGDRIGGYVLDSVLGRGGFAEVWLAHDERLRRNIALKIPRAASLNDSETSRFVREARLAANLSHSGIVTVHEVGVHEETVFIATEYVQGQTLAEWLASGRPDSTRAATICAEIADAVHFAHEQDVVHRDLKPSNVMIDHEEEVRVMDFGLARQNSQGASTMTMEGEILGTLQYMSPEQARGEGVSADRRSDVYSMGVILFELLTGEPPFQGSGAMVLTQVILSGPPSMRLLRSDIPRDLETICLKAMRKESDARYESAADFAADLRRFLKNEPIRARPITNVERFQKWWSRNRRLAWAITTAVIMLLTLAIAGPAMAYRERTLRQRAETAEARATQEALWATKQDELSIGTLETVTDALRAVERIDPVFVTALQPRMVEHQRRCEARLDELRQAEELQPDHEVLWRQQEARILRLKAQLEQFMGQHDAAIADYKRAIGIQEQLATSEPDPRASQQAIVAMAVQIARNARQSRQSAVHREYVAGHLQLAERLVRDNPALANAEFLLLKLRLQLGILNAVTKNDEIAKRFYEAAIANGDVLTERDSTLGTLELAQTLNNLSVLYTAEQVDEAVGALGKAEEMYRALSERVPSPIPGPSIYTFERLGSQTNRAMVLMRAERYAGSLELADATLDELTTIAAESPESRRLREALRNAYSIRARTHLAVGDELRSAVDFFGALRHNDINVDHAAWRDALVNAIGNAAATVTSHGDIVQLAELTAQTSGFIGTDAFTENALQKQLSEDWATIAVDSALRLEDEPGTEWLLRSAALDPIRSRPRFRDLIRRIANR